MTVKNVHFDLLVQLLPPSATQEYFLNNTTLLKVLIYFFVNVQLLGVQSNILKTVGVIFLYAAWLFMAISSAVSW
jgi:hypothetical protein